MTNLHADLVECLGLVDRATPGEWALVPPSKGRWHEDDERDLGGLKAGDEWVCTFGDSTQYYPSEGEPPSAKDSAAILAAINLLRTHRDELLGLVEDAARWRKARQFVGAKEIEDWEDMAKGDHCASEAGNRWADEAIDAIDAARHGRGD